MSGGSRGGEVASLQRALAAAGFSPGPIDGDFGPKTRAAVLAFQRAHGLTADGIAGPRTLAALRGASSTTSSTGAPAAGATSGSVLRQGSRGGEVASLQRALAAAGFSPGPVDGDFGPKTRAAVLAFQRAKGLAADGVVGPQTRSALRGADGFSSTGPSAPTSPVSGSGGALWRQAVIDEARKHLGVHEVGTNGNPFSRYFGRGNEAWCADFVSYVYTHAGHPLNDPWTPSLLSKMKANGTYSRWSPQPGDVVMFDWHPGSGYSAEHTGIVERVYSSNGKMYVDTIEGNSADAVRRRTYPLDSAYIAGFGHF